MARPLIAAASLASDASAALPSATASHCLGAVPIRESPFLLTRPNPMGSSSPATAWACATTSFALLAAAEMTNKARPARSLKLTPGASSPAPCRPDLASPAKGDRALRRTSDTHAFSFGVEEDWRGDDAFDIASAQEI